MDYDCIVIGAGFGGLSTALTLAEQGARVLLCEMLNYPGGCASTFSRAGYRFEAGATLFSGFAPKQLFANWIQTHGMQVETHDINPIVEFQTPEFRIAVPPTREALLQRFQELPNAPREELARFFQKQKEIADTLWSLFDDPALLPPFGLKELFRHALRVPRYLSLLPLIGQPLEHLLIDYGLSRFEPLRHYLNAVCQITIQVGISQAETPFALGAMDYYFRGTKHIQGGIGSLAHAMVTAIRNAGGEVILANRVKTLKPQGRGWLVETRKKTASAHTVAANLLPQDLERLLPERKTKNPRLTELSQKIEHGWGAAMLYLGVATEAPLRPEAHHLQLVGDTALPFQEGNHLFCSLGGIDETERAPAGQRTVTISTHVPMNNGKLPTATEVERIQAKMWQTLSQRAPAIVEHTRFKMTGSPRTFARFTGRHNGFVGGIPRVAGLAQYQNILPSPIEEGLYLVGDTVFPGQSTLATALGGKKLAEHLWKKLRVLPRPKREKDSTTPHTSV